MTTWIVVQVRGRVPARAAQVEAAAERDAVVDALALHGGDKIAAAQATVAGKGQADEELQKFILRQHQTTAVERVVARCLTAPPKAEARRGLVDHLEVGLLLGHHLVESVAAAAPQGSRWFGLDWPDQGDPDTVLLTRARAAGYTHLVLSPPQPGKSWDALAAILSESESRPILVKLAERPTLKTAVLLAISVWGFARAYYFAFYVVERYVDPSGRECAYYDSSSIFPLGVLDGAIGAHSDLAAYLQQPSTVSSRDRADVRAEAVQAARTRVIQESI